MRLQSVEKVGFVLSLVVLSVLYGFAAHGFGWFPNTLVEGAWRQAQPVADALFGSPPFVSDRVYDREGARTPAPERVQPGATLVSSTWKDLDWKPGLRLIDADGSVLHQWRIEPTQVFPDAFFPLSGLMQFNPVHGAYLFPDGDVLVNVPGIGTARLDACAQVVWRLRERGHHSIARADDGSFWISATEAQDGGLDRILHVSDDGRVLDELWVSELLNADDRLLRHLLKHRRETVEAGRVRDEITHLNDVEPLSASVAEEYPLFEAGDVVVSLRNLNLVFVVEPESGQVRWHASKPFLQQHDPDFIGDGWIGVFDNRRDATKRGSRLGGSRIIALQPHTDSMKVLFPTTRSDPFYTDWLGKWQRLENGNVLLTESRAGRVVEVGPDGRTVWEWIIEPYDPERVPEVTEGTRYDLTPEQVAGWPCSPGEAAGDG